MVLYLPPIFLLELAGHGSVFIRVAPARLVVESTSELVLVGVVTEDELIALALTGVRLCLWLQSLTSRSY